MLAALFPSCEKDNRLLAGGSACEDFSLSNDYGTNMHLEAGTQWHSPCFNPQNSNEFVYIHEDWHQGIAQLRRHDLTTGQWQVLVETQMGTSDRILGPPSWGSNGWILFFTLGWDTWKVKEDGTGLTKLTFTGQSQFPVWNSDAPVFHSSSISGANTSVIRDENGIILDTLTVEHGGHLSGIRHPCWAFDTLMYIKYGRFSTNDFGVASLSLVSGDITVFYSDIPSPYDIHKLDFDHSNNRLYFTTGRGLYEVDVSTSRTCKVMHFCTSIGYETFSISPQGGFMLATRITARVIDEDAWTIEFGREIYRIDLTTLIETKIVLP